MNRTIYYFLVETEEVTLTWLGGRLVPDGPHHVWLTTPGGDKTMRVRRDQVKPTSKEELAKRMVNDNRLSKLDQQRPESQ